MESEQMVNVVMIIGGLAGLLSTAAWIWIVVIAFSESLLSGLLCLLCGPYALYYAITRWGECKTPFLASLLCGIISFGSNTYVAAHSTGTKEMSQLWDQMMENFGSETSVALTEELMEADKQRLQGRWIVQSSMQAETFHIDEAQCRIQRHNSEDLYDFELVAVEGYRAIDLTSVLTDKVTKGIYVLESGRFRVCLGKPDGPRPTTFEAVEDEQELFVLRRPWN